MPHSEPQPVCVRDSFNILALLVLSLTLLGLSLPICEWDAGPSAGSLR